MLTLYLCAMQRLSTNAFLLWHKEMTPQVTPPHNHTETIPNSYTTVSWARKTAPCVPSRISLSSVRMDNSSLKKNVSVLKCLSINTRHTLLSLYSLWDIFALCSNSIYAFDKLWTDENIQSLLGPPLSLGNWVLLPFFSALYEKGGGISATLLTH